MATAWFTYAWADNESGDVDFVAQELVRVGLDVKLDRWNLRAGVRLWEQIADFIQSPSQCDAWLLFATQTSLGSEPCKEELAYALDRALAARGERFPVVALFPSTVDSELIPAAIKTRLYVSLRDPDWKERIVAAAEGRDLSIPGQQILPFHLKIHRNGSVVTFEVRPRAGTWCPFVAGIPLAEASEVQMGISHGPAGRPPLTSILYQTIGIDKSDAEWSYEYANNEATPTMSYYIQCHKVPSRLLFGTQDGEVFALGNPINAERGVRLDGRSS